MGPGRLRAEDPGSRDARSGHSRIRASRAVATERRRPRAVATRTRGRRRGHHRAPARRAVDPANQASRRRWRRVGACGSGHRWVRAGRAGGAGVGASWARARSNRGGHTRNRVGSGRERPDRYGLDWGYRYWGRTAGIRRVRAALGGDSGPRDQQARR
jgi:hypothetical protein